MDKICDGSKCTGCNACVQVCPKKAIEMKENSYGELLPVINQSKCVDCGLCKNVCQVQGMADVNKPFKCYAMWTKNDDDRKYCSSGGISTGFARQVINDGGVVFGAMYKDDEFALVIGNTDNVRGLEKFRGSKYVQCDTADSYYTAKKYLDEGRKVLYVATPCQIMGLKKFLRKEYENLILVDIICHGVPPLKHLQEHIEAIDKRNGAYVTKATFRGEHDFKLTVYEKENIIYCKDRFSDTYFTAFLDGLNYRESCYSCQLANTKRGSDITIGDFWGLNRNDMKHKYDGRISTVLINSTKGEQFFDNIKHDFEYEERTVDEAIQGNGQLQRPTRRHPNRDDFLKTYVSDGIEAAYRKSGITRKVRQNIRKSFVLSRLICKVKRKLMKKH